MASSSVQVALRVRPLNAKETLANCSECISYIPNEPQIVIGTDRSFTFDFVFNADSTQPQVYQTCVSPLIEKFLDGYNATILAYGQTGSGKTYSMGTGLDNTTASDFQGIIPRAIHYIYNELPKRLKPPSEYSVYVSFLELYNEELIDLLNPARDSSRPGSAPSANVNSGERTANGKGDGGLKIREDEFGRIVWSGVREEEAKSPEELLGFLQKGSLCRTTGSTDMNITSSRSHAIFSITLRQSKFTPKTESDSNGVEGTVNTETDGEYEKLVSKFHFVDLAGSERLKKTNAVGDRAKEGISINSGLLALGNVISALGDESRIANGVGHVPYRDSKLTRLLQDSLGGNSQTLMLACVSPADSNFQETLNTLKYANRARNIKNRVVINQDFAGNSVEVAQLRSQIARLKMELQAMRDQYGISTNSPSFDTLNRIQDTQSILNSSLQAQIQDLQNDKVRLEYSVASLQSRVKDLETEVVRSQAERDALLLQKNGWEIPDQLQAATTNPENASTQLSDNALSTSPETNPIITSYIQQITSLKSALSERETEVQFLKHQQNLTKSMFASSNASFPQSATSKQFVFGASLSNQTANDRATIKPIDSTLEKAREQIKMDMHMLMTTVKKETQEAFTAQSTDAPSSVDQPTPAEILPSTVPESVTSEGEDSESVYKALHKIQADISIKEELITQLEKTYSEYGVMRKNYEEKLKLLQDSLIAAQKDRDLALRKLETKQGGEKEKDVRTKYESKVKQLLSQISDLRRKHTESARTITSSKTRNEYMIKQMKCSIEALKIEKQRLLRKMKQEAERAREISMSSEREIQRLKKKERMASEMARKYERNYELQKLLLKRRSEEIISSNNKLKSVMSLLKRSNTPRTISKSSSNHALTGGKRTGTWRVRSVSSASSNAPSAYLDAAPSTITLSLKKNMFNKEVDQCVSNVQTGQMLDELLRKRQRLIGEKLELLAERERVVLATAEANNSDPDHSAPQYMDDRLELVDAEVSYINTRIKALLPEVANTSDGAPLPLDSLSTSGPNNVPSNAVAVLAKSQISTQTGYENAVNLIRNLNHDESVQFLEMVLEDFIHLRIREKTLQMTVSNLETNTEDLRKSLMLMRNAAMSSAVQYETKLRSLKSASHTAFKAAQRSQSLSLSSSSPSQRLETSSGDSQRRSSTRELMDEKEMQSVASILDVYGDGMFSHQHKSPGGEARRVATQETNADERERHRDREKDGKVRRSKSASPNGKSRDRKMSSSNNEVGSRPANGVRDYANIENAEPNQLMSSTSSNDSTSPSQLQSSSHYQISNQGGSDTGLPPSNLSNSLSSQNLSNAGANPLTRRRPNSVAGPKDVFERLSTVHTVASQAKVKAHHPSSIEESNPNSPTMTQLSLSQSQNSVNPQSTVYHSHSKSNLQEDYYATQSVSQVESNLPPSSVSYPSSSNPTFEHSQSPLSVSASTENNIIDSTSVSQPAFVSN